MRKETFDRIFGSRVFYIVFSILASVALWLYVEYTQNPDETRAVSNIPIVFINEDVLRDKNFVITEKSNETVSIVFNCKRNMFSQLTSSTLSAVVDLSNISTTGRTQLKYTISYPQGLNTRSLTIASSSVENVYVTVDRLHEKPVPVATEYTGGTASAEYVAEAPIFNPDTITVYGPESVVSTVSKIWIPIKREKLSKTVIDDFEFMALDENNNEIDSSELSFSQDTVRVTIPIKMLKDITLSVDIVAGAGATEQNTKVVIIPTIPGAVLSTRPAKITVSGDPDALREFNNITLGTIDLTKIELSSTQTFAIVVPNSFVNESGETEAIVSLEVIGLEVRRFAVTNLQAVNTPRGHTHNIIPQSVNVKVRGTPELLDALTPANFRLVVDLTDYRPGTASVPAKVFIDGDVGDVGAVGDYAITVQLIKD